MIIFETDRLILKKFRNEDIPIFHVIFSDAETMKYYPAPFSLEQTEQWVNRNQNRYEEDGFGLWGIWLKETNELIGDCGLVKQKVDGQTEVEIGYHLNKNYWSQGYATEAAKGCRDYGFYQLGLTKLISIIEPRNLPSIRVAERVGFTKEKESIVFNKNHYVYSKIKDTKDAVEIN